MVALALTVVALLGRLPLAAVLGLSTVAWVGTAVAGYHAVGAVRRHRTTAETTAETVRFGLRLRVWGAERAGRRGPGGGR